MMRDKTPSKMAKMMSRMELLPLVDTDMSPEADSASGRKCTLTAADALKTTDSLINTKHLES